MRPSASGPAVVVPIAGARRRTRLAHVSHELRGALTAADLALARLEREPGRRVPATASAVRAQLERASLALDELDSVRGSPPARTSLHLAAAGLEEVVRRRVQAWSAAAPDGRAVRIRCAAVSGVVAPPSLIPALDNLIANALEHGRGTVTVSVGQDARHVTITIADEGSGMPGASHLRRTLPERGLGLQIARRATHASGGRLIAEPGSPPRLELPVAAIGPKPVAT